MAIVACPFCGKKISSKAAACNHCGNGVSEVSPEQLAIIDRDRRHQLNQSINNHAMIALVLFLGSVLYLYTKFPEAGSWQYYSTYVVMAVGAIGYVISKVRMILFKRQ